MNKLFTKIAGLTLGLAMAIGVGVALGSKNSDVKAVEAAVTAAGGINFKTGSVTASNTGTTINGGTMDITTIGTQTNAGYYNSKVTAATYSYYSASGGVGGIRVGKSSGAGTIKFTLTTAVTDAVRVDVESYQTAANATKTLWVDESSTDAVTPSDSTATIYEFDLSSVASLTTITIKTSSQLWVKSFKLYVGRGSSGPATSGTATFTPTSASAATIGGTYPTDASVTFSNTYTSTYTQMTSGNYQTYTIKKFGGKKLTSIKPAIKRNSGGGGTGNITVKNGTTTLVNERAFTKTSIDKDNFKDYEILGSSETLSITGNNDLIVIVKATENSLHCNKLSITWENSDSITSLAVTNPKVSFTVGQPFTHVKDNTTVVTATYATAGATTVSSGFTYTLGGTAVTTSYTMAKADNGKTVVVTYTDGDGLSKAADGYAISVDYETLDSDHLTMTTGPVNVSLSDGTVQLSASVTNPNADPTITWSSGDTDKATVNSSGLVTLKAAGSVVITASGANSVSKTCTVIISATPSVTLDVTTISNKYTGDPDVTITPDAKNVPNDAVYIWTSTNNNVATVTKGAGNVGVVHFEGTSSHNESITLTIKNAAETETLCSASATLSNITKSEVLDLTLSESTHTLYDGKFVNSFTLTATIDDEDVIGNANKNITWTSSDPTIADVDNGEVVVLGEGGDNENPVTVTITAASTYSPSISRTCTVTVLHDTVNKITWNGKNTPASFFTGDVLKNVSNWTFDAEWASGGKENGLSWGTGSNVVHLNKCAVGVNLTPETDNPLARNYEVVIGDNNKRLVPFYGEFAATAKTMTVNQSAVSDIEISLDDRIVNNELDMYDTEELTLDYTVTYVGNVNDGVDVDVSDDEKLIYVDNGTDGHGNGTITISGYPCNSVTLTLTSKEDSSVEETITIHIEEDEVQSLSWTGSGVSDVLEYESNTSTLGQVLDSSNWTFTATWIKKVESNLTVGSGADNVNLGIFNTNEPSAYSEGTVYNASSILDIELNGKYLVAFYKGVRASETIKLNIVKTLDTISKPAPSARAYSWVEEDATPDFSKDDTSVNLNGVTWTKNTQSQDIITAGTKAVRYNQIGRSAGPDSLILTTSGISGTITKITIDCFRGASTDSKVSATVGGDVFMAPSNIPAQSSNIGGEVSATGSKSGTIVITLEGKGSSGAQVAIHSIEIEYTTTVNAPISNDEDHKEAQFAVVEFAQYMNEQMNGKNVCTGTSAQRDTAWANVKAKYNALFGPERTTTFDDTELNWAKDLLTNAHAEWNEIHDSDQKYCLERALATYEFCVAHYYSNDAFMSGVRTLSSNSGAYLNTVLSMKNTSAVIIIVVISAISVAAIGGYFLFRKKKDN